MPKWTLEDVTEYMKLAHRGQFRNDDVTPYDTHPVRVLEIAQQIYGPRDGEIISDIDFKAACLLHDVDEDCFERGFTLENIEQHFGRQVAEWCRWVTKPSLPPAVHGYGYHQKLQYKAIFNTALYRNLAFNGPRPSHLLKFADRLANLEDAENWGNRFREKYIYDTKNLVESFQGIDGIEVVELRLAEIIRLPQKI